MGKANQKFAFIKGAFIQRCSVNKLFFKISQNSQEVTCAKLKLLP